MPADHELVHLLDRTGNAWYGGESTARGLTARHSLSQN